MASETENRQAFAIQAGYCRAMGAPVTASVSETLGRVLDRTTETGRRALDWPGDPVADALVLRMVGGLHALALGGDPELARVFGGEVEEEALADAIATHDAAILPWLDGPPQTNEAGRSAGLMTGLLAVADGRDTVFELLEIGSSAGLNLLIDRLRYDLGGVGVGPADAPVTIRPEWRGSPPMPASLRFEPGPRGVDVRPVDLSDDAAVKRLRGYVWADARERLERLDRTVAMVRAQGVALERGDAADWVEARLAEPQAAGRTRVLVHSVVWQYLGPERQARITAAMERAGAGATDARPLAWVAMEPDRSVAEMVVTVRRWPGRPDPRRIARTQSHGAWVEPVDKNGDPVEEVPAGGGSAGKIRERG